MCQHHTCRIVCWCVMQAAGTEKWSVATGLCVQPPSPHMTFPQDLGSSHLLEIFGRGSRPLGLTSWHACPWGMEETVVPPYPLACPWAKLRSPVAAFKRQLSNQRSTMEHVARPSEEVTPFSSSVCFLVYLTAAYLQKRRGSSLNLSKFCFFILLCYYMLLLA